MSFVATTRQGAVLTLTLNRPERRNAIGEFSECEDIIAACAAANADPTVGVVILTGAGTAFSAGGDLKRIRERSGILEGDSGVRLRDAYRRGVQRVQQAIYGLEMPAIAAVNGPALGLGCDLACACDIRIAGEQAIFASTFVRLGLVPGDGGAWLLPRAVGASRAAEMCFTGRNLSAADALAAGLVSRVVPGPELIATAHALAAEITANSGPAVRLAKRLLREADHARFDTVLEMSAAFQALCHQTPEHHQALDALLARR